MKVGATTLNFLKMTFLWIIKYKYPTKRGCTYLIKSDICLLSCCRYLHYLCVYSTSEMTIFQSYMYTRLLCEDPQICRFSGIHAIDRSGPFIYVQHVYLWYKIMLLSIWRPLERLCPLATQTDSNRLPLPRLNSRPLPLNQVVQHTTQWVLFSVEVR